MTLLVIEPADVPLFVKQVGPHEEIRPVPVIGGKLDGKFILHEGIQNAGPAYALEFSKPHYLTKTKPGDSEDLPKGDGAPTVKP